MYCSIEDISKDLSLDVIIRLVNDENLSPDTIDLTDEDSPPVLRITEQIKAASTEIDGYIRSRYTVPMLPIPDRVKHICKDISIYNLYKRRFRLEMPESLVSIYKQRTSELEKIQKGIINLDVQEPPSGSGQFVINKTSNDRVFGKDVLNGF